MWAKGCVRLIWSAHLGSFGAGEWKAQTRSAPRDFDKLLEVLKLSSQLPDEIRAARNLFTAEQALFVFLVRKSYPSSRHRLQRLLGGRARSAYVAIFYFMLDWIRCHYVDCINDIGRWEAYMPQRAQAQGLPVLGLHRLH